MGSTGTLPAKRNCLTCLLGTSMWRVGGVDALPPKTVSESVALVLPMFATCHILDLRSFQFGSLTRIRLGAFPTQEPGLHLESRQALARREAEQSDSNPR